MALGSFVKMKTMSTDIAISKKTINGKPIYKKETFPVLEMTCAACAISVESMLKSVEGVKNAGVNFANQDAWVEYDPAIATPELRRSASRSTARPRRQTGRQHPARDKH